MGLDKVTYLKPILNFQASMTQRMCQDIPPLRRLSIADVSSYASKCQNSPRQTNHKWSLDTLRFRMRSELLNQNRQYHKTYLDEKILPYERRVRDQMSSKLRVRVRLPYVGTSGEPRSGR